MRAHAALRATKPNALQRRCSGLISRSEQLAAQAAAAEQQRSDNGSCRENSDGRYNGGDDGAGRYSFWWRQKLYRCGGRGWRLRHLLQCLDDAAAKVDRQRRAVRLRVDDDGHLREREELLGAAQCVDKPATEVRRVKSGCCRRFLERCGKQSHIVAVIGVGQHVVSRQCRRRHTDCNTGDHGCSQPLHGRKRRCACVEAAALDGAYEGSQCSCSVVARAAGEHLKLPQLPARGRRCAT